MLAALEKFRDAVHRAGAVERDDGGDIFERLRPQRGAYARDARRFKLEYAGGLARGEHVEHGRIVHRDGVDGEIRFPAPDELGRVFEHREIAKAEKVHFQQPQLLERRHRILRDRVAVVRGERDIFVNRPVRDDNAGGVGRGVARHALERAGGVDEILTFSSLSYMSFRGLESLSASSSVMLSAPGPLGTCLATASVSRVAEIQRAADVADGHARGHRAEGDDLRNVVRAVFARNVVDDLAAAAHAEVHIDIGHAHALGV